MIFAWNTELIHKYKAVLSAKSTTLELTCSGMSIYVK